MATTLTPTLDEHVILHDVSWDTYERLLADLPESRPVRLYYDQGVLEIMVLSEEHERLRRAFTKIVDEAEHALDHDVDPVGSATVRRKELKRGFEPDDSYHIGGAAPGAAPDLVLEIDITHSSMNKLPLFAAVGIAEVWRWSHGRLSMYALRSGEYAAIDESTVLPGVRREDLERLVTATSFEPRSVWRKRVRTWAESLRK